MSSLPLTVLRFIDYTTVCVAPEAWVLSSAPLIMLDAVNGDVIQVASKRLLIRIVAVLSRYAIRQMQYKARPLFAGDRQTQLANFHRKVAQLYAHSVLLTALLFFTFLFFYICYSRLLGSQALRLLNAWKLRCYASLSLSLSCSWRERRRIAAACSHYSLPHAPR